MNEVGSQEIKTLFNSNNKKIAKDVIKNPKSKDGDALVKSIETTISGKNFNELEEIWNYIKSFRRKLKLHLNADEEAELVKSINEQKRIIITFLVRVISKIIFQMDLRQKFSAIKLLQGQNYVDWKKRKNIKNCIISSRNFD